MPSLRDAVDNLLDAPAPADMPDNFAQALAELRANRGHWAEQICGVPTDAERAIRRDERRLIARLSGDDIRRTAHLIGRVLSDPAATNDQRQEAARILDPKTKKRLLHLLDGDLCRMGLFLAALLEPVDPEWKAADGG